MGTFFALRILYKYLKSTIIHAYDEYWLCPMWDPGDGTTEESERILGGVYKMQQACNTRLQITLQSWRLWVQEINIFGAWVGRFYPFVGHKGPQGE